MSVLISLILDLGIRAVRYMYVFCLLRCDYKSDKRSEIQCTRLWQSIVDSKYIVGCVILPTLERRGISLQVRF